jgi:hypothetical protein
MQSIFMWTTFEAETVSISILSKDEAGGLFP